MNTNDTPRTDAVRKQCHPNFREDAFEHLSEYLELQLAHSLANQVEAQAEVARLRELLNRAIEIALIVAYTDSPALWEELDKIKSEIK